MKKISIYLGLAVMFSFVRQYFMPNPFDVLGEGVILSIFGPSRLFTPTELNFYAEPITHGFTLWLVSLYYERKSNPTLGCVLYMIFYCVHAFLLHCMAAAYPTVWLIVLIVGAYAAFHIAAITRMNNI